MSHLSFTRPAQLAVLARAARQLLVRTAQAWLDQRASSKGAALAFYALFSLAPMLLVVIAVSGAVFGHDAAQGALFARLHGLLGTDGARAVEALLVSVRSPASGLLATLVAALLLLIGSTSVLSELKASLDEIWQVPRSVHGGVFDFLRTRMLSLSMLMILALLLMASLLLSTVLTAFASLAGAGAPLVTLLSGLVSFAAASCLFAAIYKILPQVTLSFRDVWIGAIGTSAMFMLGKQAIALYLSVGNVVSAYGAAGSLIAVLLWIYYSGQIFFLGAEFTHQYALMFGSLAQQSMPSGLAGAKHML